MLKGNSCDDTSQEIHTANVEATYLLTWNSAFRDIFDPEVIIERWIGNGKLSHLMGLPFATIHSQVQHSRGFLSCSVVCNISLHPCCFALNVEGKIVNILFEFI